jgi:hypothetical protein
MPQLPLKHQLIERSSRAAAEGKWHLASVLYAALEAIDVDDMINDTGRDAWSIYERNTIPEDELAQLKDRLREVPLIKLPMHDDRARPVDCPAVGGPILRCVQGNPAVDGVRCDRPAGHDGSHRHIALDGQTRWL